jgi:signal transduction histidine kinase
VERDLPAGHGEAPRTWCWAADVVVVCALCLAQPLLVDPDLLVRYLGWVASVASFAVVALQWHLAPVPAAVSTVAVCVAFTVGAAAAPEVSIGQALAAGGVWFVVEAVLSRLLWRLVGHGGRVADRLMSEQFEQEREAVLAAARRADQRAHWATVHDTSASTLLMVGLGEVRGDEDWLADQVRHDITALRSDLEPDGTTLDVVARLADVAGRAHVAVALDGPDRLDVPANVAAAVAGAVTAALENVHRHSGAGQAAVVVRRTGDRLVVTVTDTGIGFDTAAVPAGHFGLAWSVHERMAKAGGHAHVQSAPQAGTVVRLEWQGE